VPTSSSESPPSKQNGALALLSELARSGNAWVQFGTLVLIAFTGLGNGVATWNASRENKAEIETNRRVAWEGEQRIKAVLVQQVAEIHNWMKDATSEFHQGNADSASNKKLLAKFQDELEGFESRQLRAIDGIQQSLRNQNVMMDNETRILQEIRGMVERFERYKKLEQERGAPP